MILTDICLMNSTITALSREIIGRANLGDGATKTEGVDWKNDVETINPDFISKENRFKIINAFTKIKLRPIQSIFNEVKLKDRREPDSLVLEAMGLDPEKYLKRIYEGITELVNERLSLPKMRKKDKKAKITKSLDQIADMVRQEILPSGLRQFPESFINSAELKRAKDIPVSGKPLKYRNEFLTIWEILDSEGQKIYQTDNEDAAKFIVYSYKPDTYTIKIPAYFQIIRNIVSEYDNYIKETRNKIVQRVFEATFDHSAAEKIAGEILGE